MTDTGGQGLFRPQVSPPSAGRRLDGLVRVTSPRWWLSLFGVGLLLAAAGVWSVFGSAPTEVAGQGLLIGPRGLDQVDAPVQGTVLSISVDAGDRIRSGQAVAALQQGSGTTVEVVSRIDGEAVLTTVHPGEVVQPGTALVEVLPEQSAEQAQVFVPAHTGAAIRPGMAVRVNPLTAPAAQYGSIVGRVLSVSRVPLPDSALAALVGGNDALVQELRAEGAPLQIQVGLETDGRSPSGHRWTSGHGPALPIPPASLLSAVVVLEERRPLDLLLNRGQVRP